MNLHTVALCILIQASEYGAYFAAWSQVARATAHGMRVGVFGNAWH